MNTILVVFSNENLSLEQINNRKMQKYCFRTESTITVGDILKSKFYSSNLIVTDEIGKEYKYYNSQTGEMSDSITSTKCYPIKELILREENEEAIYASKVSK